MNEKAEKVKMLLGLAEIFDFKFSEASLRIYLQILENVSIQSINDTISKALQTNRWKFMPKPGEFFTSGDGEIHDSSVDAAHLCWGAIARFGRMDYRGAEKQIGELGWAVVQRMGGWNSVCDVLIENKSHFIAQFRELAQSLSRKAERNELDLKPSLPQPKSNLERLGEFTKKIGELNE